MCRLARSIVILSSLVVVLLIGACSAPSSPTQAPPAAATQAPPAAATQAPPQPTAAMANPASYDDPFAYCAAVGTVDAPAAPYNGPDLPDAVVQSMIRQGIITADAPPEFQKAAVWRCMDGQVWACHFGANLPCQEKADSSQAPSPAMEEFCQANPTADYIPAAVTGRATVYEWRCAGGKPEVVRQLFQVDPQGYLADFWYELASASTTQSSAFARDVPLRFDVGPMVVEVSGAVVSGQRDRYTVSLITGELLQVELTALESNGAFSIMMPDGTALPGTEEGVDIASGFWIVPADGVYAIIVGPTRGNASYTLYVQTQDPAYAPSPDCAAIGAAAEQALGVKFTQSTAAFNDGGKSGGVGCVLTASSTGAQWDNPQVPIDQLHPVLSDWVDEGMPGAGAGVAYVFFKDAQWLMASSSWRPSSDANCPSDQPISACTLKPEQKLYTLELTIAQGVWTNMAFKPVRRDVCRQLNMDVGAALGVGLSMSFAAPFRDFLTGESGMGCTLEASGTGADFQSLPAVMDKLRGALIGWQEDPNFAADGPTGTATAFVRDSALLLVTVGWEPAPDANCPQDQPISACPLQPEQQLYSIKLQAAQN
jgi:hypothetical protein